MNVLVTGADGYVGRLVTRALADRGVTVVATDARPIEDAPAGVHTERLDIRDPNLAHRLRHHQIDRVVHLAAVVKPGPRDTRQVQYSVDVDGTRNVLDACVAAGVSKLVYTSSGAAYGYTADNGPLLAETDPLRADDTFAYAWHKRMAEEVLAEFRTSNPDLAQLVFRVSTILGPTVHSPVTDLFEGRVVFGIRGVDSPFCFAWDGDVVACIVDGVLGDQVGTYNLTGDGVMTLREVAHHLGRRYVGVPLPLLKRSLAALHRRGLTPHGPEQTLFLEHRPVLSNRSLKRDFGYTPRTSRQVFEAYRSSRG